MPSNQHPLGALPSRFRRTRVLIVGCGDVGLRVARALPPAVRVLALTSTPSRASLLRARGITPLPGNLDDPRTLARLAGLADHVIHLAPPASEAQDQWWRDRRTQALLQSQRLRTAPRSFVYASTSGVYGDCGGDRAVEARAVAPRTPRAQRRADAERQVRFFARATGARASILRVPGIYAPDREGGTPRDRLLKGTPVLAAGDDVYTNHIHADDLARTVVAALWRGRPLRTYNANDDTELKMGDYFDFAADLYGLPRPPRVARSTAQEQLPLVLLSFMGESRRLDNGRMKRELRVRLSHPTVASGLRG
ncbi:MAG TPA: NAD-dependent epimerase/dehydratase family protein [Ramlibacter sp.]|uniref:NAD-dependent epimerase/dehydratase family protein n=1 Tax=Ramlibacter sp. TaxID=1917967 RepID=UPI002ED36512